MKTKITKNDIKSYKKYIIPEDTWSILTKYLTPRYYNSGIYGWNYDTIIFDKTALIGGYRPVGEPIPADMLTQIDTILADADNDRINGKMTWTEAELYICDRLAEVLQ